MACAGNAGRAGSGSDVEMRLSEVDGWPKGVAGFVRKIWNGIAWIGKNVRVQPIRKSLRVCETVSLGERRFVAVIQVDGERYLIGGGTGAISLLSKLQSMDSMSGQATEIGIKS